YVFHSFRIMNFKYCTFFQKFFDVVECGCLADIVGMRLERKSPDRDSFTLQIIVEVRFDTGYETCFLSAVHIHHRVQYLEIILYILRRFGKGLNIFREAASPITNTREQESFTNTAIGSDASSYRVNICA